MASSDLRFQAFVTILEKEGVEVSEELAKIMLPALNTAGYNSVPVSTPIAQLSMKLKPLADDGKVRTGYALFSHLEFARLASIGVAGPLRNQQVAQNWKALGKEGQNEFKKGQGVMPTTIASQPVVAEVPKPRAQSKYNIFMSWAMKEQSYVTAFPAPSARLRQLAADWKAKGKEAQAQWVTDLQAGKISVNQAPKKEKATKAKVTTPIEAIAPVEVQATTPIVDEETTDEIEAINQVLDEMPESEDEEEEEEEEDK